MQKIYSNRATKYTILDILEPLLHVTIFNEAKFNLSNVLDDHFFKQVKSVGSVCMSCPGRGKWLGIIIQFGG